MWGRLSVRGRGDISGDYRTRRRNHSLNLLCSARHGGGARDGASGGRSRYLEPGVEASSGWSIGRTTLSWVGRHESPTGSPLSQRRVSFAAMAVADSKFLDVVATR